MENIITTRVETEERGNNKWDNQIDTLLTELNDSVAGSSNTHQRFDVRSAMNSSFQNSGSAVNSSFQNSGSAVNRSFTNSGSAVNSSFPNSGYSENRREYMSPDQKTHVVEERREYVQRDGSNQISSNQIHQTDFVRGKNHDKITYDLPDHGLSLLEGTSGKNYSHTSHSEDNVSKMLETTVASGNDRTTPGLDVSSQYTPFNLLHGLDRKLVPELHEVPQTGTTRVTKYEYQRCNRQLLNSPGVAGVPAPIPGSDRTRTEWQEYNTSNSSQNMYRPELTQKTVDRTDAAQSRSYQAESHHGRPAPSITNNTMPKATYEYKIDRSGTSSSERREHTAFEGKSDSCQQYMSNTNQQYRTPDARHPQKNEPCPKFPVNTETRWTHRTTEITDRTATSGSPFPVRRSPSPAVRSPRENGPRLPLPNAPQQPVDQIDAPKRVDELLAQIPDVPQDGTYPDGPRRRELQQHGTQFTLHESQPLMDSQTRVTLDAHSGAVVQDRSGPPPPAVYYPPSNTNPAVKGDEQSQYWSQQQQGRYGGKYKSGYKASGKYKAKSGSKERHAESGAVIPVCLPLCCGAACSVM